jgi:Uri superfamily endonuclease
LPTTKGSYILVLNLAEETRLTVGRLGTFEFPAGQYFYCGSALNGLESRIRRHLRRDKKRHWHVDHLTAVAPVAEVWWVQGEERWECRWAKAMTTYGAEVVARGFGSSDCRCQTHLLRKKPGADLTDLRQLLLSDCAPNNWGVTRVRDNEGSPAPHLESSYRQFPVILGATRSSSA